MGLPPERELIDLVTRSATVDRNRAGFASDCAIVPFEDRELVATVDTFAQASHFPPGTPTRMAGHLATAATLSDLAAAGAELVGALVGLGLPSELTEAQVRELGQAVSGLLEEHGGELLGGDTKPRQELTLAVTALGTCPPGQAMTREGAEPGDRLLLTGPLGGAGAALERIQAGEGARKADPLLSPQPRLPAGQLASEAGVRCAMDLSDGLADAAAAIAEVSETRLAVDADAVPLHPWAQDAEEGLDWALTTGGDYELLASVPPEALDRVEAGWDALGLDWSEVGRVEDGQGAVLLEDGDAQVLERGYEHRFDG